MFNIAIRVFTGQLLNKYKLIKFKDTQINQITLEGNNESEPYFLNKAKHTSTNNKKALLQDLLEWQYRHVALNANPFYPEGRGLFVLIKC